ncbi:MAG TPA: DUF2950 domain-containing protein [Terriglobales bacterium]|jgi:hypothetical protein|nr:DUF2950 domain-containing protein [Terriglobales bacterium]
MHLQPVVLVAGLFYLMTAMPLSAQAISGQKTFSSSSEAVQALLEAAKSGDPAQLEPLLGPQAPQLIASGDAGAAKDLLAGFVKAYGEKHSLSVEAQGFEYLQVGTSDWPFPFPIVRDGKVWYFDVDRGNQEILDRRIGRDELGAIAVCEGYVQSQIQYASKGRDGNPSGVYAQRFKSNPGKQDGLYWPVSKGEHESPMGPFVASASAAEHAGQPAESPIPYYGYVYRILTEQGADAPGGAKNYMVDGKLTGGFALIAYPAEYRSSGVMTFIVSQDGVIYQQDLGDQTAGLASRITAYNPDSSWESVKQ